MPSARKTRRVLQTDVTEVPLADENPSPPPPPLASAWDSAFAQDNPPLKRFKMPEAILQRIGRSAAQAPPVPAVANDEVIDAIRVRRSAQRPVVSVQRTPRFYVRSNEHFANSNDDIIRFDDVRKAAAEDDGRSSCTGSSLAPGDGSGGDATARAKRRRGKIDLHFEGFESDELEGSVGSSSDEGSDDDDDDNGDDNGDDDDSDDDDEMEEDGDGYIEESEDSEVDENEKEENEEKETPTLSNPSNGSIGVRGGFGLLERRKRTREGLLHLNHSEQEETKHEEKHQHPQTHIQQGQEHQAEGEEPLPDHTQGRRHRYSGMFFETHIGRTDLTSCHHTLLCLTSPITVQGPCAVIGFGMGEVTVGGFFLGRKQLVLLSEQQRVVVTPVRKLKLKNASLDAPPTPQRLLHNEAEPAALLPPVLLPTPQLVVGEEGETGNEEWTEDVEGLFGGIDWDWVEAKVAAWRGRYASKMPNVVLVVQPCDPAPMRRHYFKRHMEISRKKNMDVTEESDAYMDIPRFVARRHEPGIDVALLPDVVPAVLKQSNGAVAVVGSQGIGKSTLARFLANGFLSQYGVCYWLDLDLGQPEFTPPGVLSLSCVRRPLLRPRDASCVETVRSYYLGGTRLHCPVATAIAIERLCAVVERIQRRHPVVINTHGWVLSTGRRMSVEAIRRLQPRHIIHLVKECESRWARDGAALMDPAIGLNSEALHRRFIVQPGKDKELGRLPHPFREHSAGPSLPNEAKLSAWPGTVHTVQVERGEELPRRGTSAPKASTVRQGMWQQHLAPLFRYYEHRGQREITKRGEQNGQKQKDHGGAVREDVEDDRTSVLEGPLGKFHRIVITDAASSKDITESIVCAALEHSVVAIAIQCGPPAGATETGQRYSCLAEEQWGFPFSVFGFVESTEMEMRETGNVRIRLPLSRDAVRRMWTSASPDNVIHVSIACTLMDRMDTAALENYF